jgi:hypothetical protein
MHQESTFFLDYNFLYFSMKAIKYILFIIAMEAFLFKVQLQSFGAIRLVYFNYFYRINHFFCLLFLAAD